jgi:predicted metalloprotease with PDZ domain
VKFDRLNALRRSLGVTMTFQSGGTAPVLLSLPAWTPGAYELSFFAGRVREFKATAAGKDVPWEKVDPDTWRVRPVAGEIAVSFSYRADSLDNAMAWARDDFAFFNGTNVFLYPEGNSAAFPATVRIETERDWHVATGMRGSAATRSYTASNFHELVDMPVFVGVFDLDSALVLDKWMRLATYPAEAMVGESRTRLWDQLNKMMPPMAAVFGDLPYDSYTNLIVFDTTLAGGSALEHANSHMGVYTPFIIESLSLPSITAHEIFHLWNVKRMRPADMVPYRYDRAQPTPWLWVSEGITDYYADLALVRGGVIDSAAFLDLTQSKIDEVSAVPPVALEDASLSTWVKPDDGTGYIYYPKGSLAGLLLDIQIRDLTDNAASLDSVMRDVYHTTAGRGFTGAEWWGAVSRAAKGASFAQFNARFVDGRDPLPYDSVLPLAGIRLRVDTLREPIIGISTIADSVGVRVTDVTMGSAAGVAGVQPGDYLISFGAIRVTEGFGERFRARYGKSPGADAPVVLRRAGTELTLPMKVRLEERYTRRLEYERDASAKAARVRSGILRGS